MGARRRQTNRIRRCGGSLGGAAILVVASVIGALAPAALAPSTASAGTTPQVSGGGNYTCALLPSGSVDCWGVNPWGQLGNGTTNDSDVPVQVAALPAASAITTGTGHTCALDTSGHAFCWGTDSYGELGNGNNNNKLAPVPVSGGLEFSQIAAGGFATSGAFPTADYTCGVTKAGPASGPGQVWCWGYNGFGQLGNNTTTNSNVPVAVSGLPAGAVQVATGPGHACAALTDGSVWCWGLGKDGQLGNNNTKNKKSPVQAVGLVGAMAVGAGTSHSCALLASGGMMCWGNNASGQLGNGTTDSSDVPVPVGPLAGTVQQIALGGDHTCALIGNPQSEVECWGDDQRGDLGDGNMQEPPVTSPEAVFGLAGSAASGQGVVPTAIGAGNAHSCSFVLTGQLYCWGANLKGEVGDGTKEDRDVPTLVLGITPGTQQISEGSGGGCALTSGLGVKCWGGFDGNDFVVQQSAEAVAALPGGVAAVSAGAIDGCAVSTSGSLQCWGGNERGEVGNGTTDPQPTPVGVSGLSSGVGFVSEGDTVTCATKGKKVNLLCWGANDRGQLGDDTTTDRSVPVSIPYEAMQVSNGFDNTCAVVLGGVNPDFAVCMGANDFGQLGNGKTNTGVAHPVKVKNLPGTPVQVAVGGDFNGSPNPADHSCAVLTSGAVYCWGVGGALGNGSSSDSSTPVEVSLSGPAKQVIVGSAFACALLMTGSVQCWGSDFQGELGDGGPPTSWPLTPVNVGGLSQIVQISGNGATQSACALSATGTVSCWGDNSTDELGDGTSGGSSNTPQPVMGL